MKRFLERFLPHLVIILAVMGLVLQVLNEFNPYMGFLSGDATRVWTLCFIVLALVNAIVSVVRDRKGK